MKYLLIILIFVLCGCKGNISGDDKSYFDKDHSPYLGLPAIFNASIDSATSNSVTVRWDSSLGAVSYVVKFKKATDSSWTDAGTNVQSPFTVTGLQSSTLYNFKVTASNDKGGIDSNVVNMTTSGSVFAPRVVKSGHPSFNEDVEEIVTLNYTQPGADVATACQISDLENVTVTRACQCDGAGVCTVGITGAPNYYGPGSFNYRVLINEHASTSEMIWFTINPVDDAPSITNISNVASNEDSGAVINFTVHDPDTTIECTSSFLTATSSNSSLLLQTGITFGGTYPNCTATLTPLHDAVGVTNMTIKVSDGNLMTTSNTFTYTTHAVNDAPVIGSLAAASTNEDVAKVVNFTISDVDSTLTCVGSVSGSSSNIGLVSSNNIVISGTAPNCVATITPTLYQNGSTQITLSVTDGYLTTAGVFTLSVAAINNAPILSFINNKTINEDEPTVINFTFSDVDSNVHCNASYLSASSSNTLVVLSTDVVFGGTAPNCTATISPLANKYGSTNISITGTDGALSVTSSPFTLTVSPVNDRPTISSILPQSTLQEVAKAVNFTIGDIDSSLTCSSVAGSSSNTAIVANASIVISGTYPNCTATITPSVGQSGAVDITLTVSDGSLTNSSIFSFYTTAVNAAPTISNINVPTVTEDTSAVITFTVNDPDSTLSCTPAHVSGTSTNTTLLPGSNIVFGGTYPNCSVTVTPQANQTGTTDITISVTDGVATTSTPPLTVTVAPVNDAPTISTVTAKSTNQDTAKVVNFTIDDVDSTISCSSVTGSSSNTTILPNASIAIGGTFPNCTATLTPAAGKNGSVTVTLTVSDGSLSASTIFPLTIVAVNAAPTITSTLLNTSINEDGSGTVNFTVNDPDSTIACSSSYLSATSSNATLIVSTDITFSGTYPNCTATITPLANQNGSTNITFTITDGSLSSTSNAFTFTVNAVNDAPTISPIMAQAINQDTSTSVNFTINDVDSTLTCSGSVSASSSNTSIVSNAGIVISGTYPNCSATVTPVAGKSGSPNITFTVTDGSLSNSSVFALSINAVNAAPTISTLSNASTAEDVPTTLNFTIGDVDSTLDCTSSHLSATSSNSTLVPTSNITFGGAYPNCTATLSPALNAYGTSSITIRVTDGVLTTTSNSVTLTVTAVDDAPVISPIATQNWASNQTSSVSFTITDVDSTLNCSSSMSAASSDTNVVSLSNITFGGTAPNCTATIIPSVGQVGPVTLTFTVTSGSLNASTSFEMTFGSATTPPVASNITPASFNEDTQSMITLSYNSGVALASSCYVSSLSNVFISTPCTCDGAGVCTVGITGNQDYHGAASFNYTVTANSASSAPASAAFVILPVADAPTISSVAAQSMNEDGSKVVNFTIADVDSTLTCSSSVSVSSSNTSLVGASNIAIAGTAPNCTATISPIANANGTASITLTVSDGSLSAQSSFNLTVVSVNDAPTMAAISAQTTNEDTAKVVNFTIDDPDTTLTCSGSVMASSSNSSIVNAASIVFGGSYPNCTATITPQANMIGSPTITFTVSDGALSASQSFTLTINAVNDAPEISTIAAQSTPEYTAKTVSFTITDVDSTLTCSGSVSANSSNTTLLPNASIVISGSYPNCTATMTPALYQNGLANVTLTVSDGFLSAQSVFALTVTAVNHAPTISSISAQATNEDTTKNLNFTIGDIDSMITCSGSVTATSSDTSIVALTGITFSGNYPNCTASIAPQANMSGTSSLTFTVTDGSLSNSQTFNLTVNAVNDAPEISTIATQSTPEGSAKSASFTINDIDSTLTCSGSVTGSSSNTTILPNSGIIVTGTYPNCSVTMTPAQYQNGSVNVTLTVSDGALSVQSSFALNITPVNDAPTISTIAATSTNEDTVKVVSFTIGDVDSTLSCASSITAASSDGAVVSPGSITFGGTYPNCTASISPVANAYGVTNLTFTVSDGSLTAAQTFALTVNSVNDAPEMGAIAAQSTLEHTSKNVSFTLSDVDNALTCSGNVTGSSSNTTIVPNSAITISGTMPNCTATILPALYQNGSVTITLSATDGSLTTQRSFLLTVIAVNDAPIIAFISNVTTDEDTVKTLSFTVNDVDSTIACNSSYLSATSSNASLLLSTDIVFGGTYPNCTATFTALANQNGTSNITITASDGIDSSTSNVFQFIVAAVNDAPTIATVMAQSTDEDTVKSVNFTIGDIDSTLTCSGSVTATSSDTSLISNSNMTVTGTYPNCSVAINPSLNKNGTATITLQVSDGSLSASSSFAFTVNAINDAPTMNVIANQTTNEDTGIVIPVLVDDVDGPLNCAFRLTSTSSNTSLIAVANIVMGGTYPNCTATVTPSPNQNGYSDLTFTVSDGALSASRSFRLTVTAVDDAPVTTNISSASVTEDIQSIITLPYTDVDGDQATSCSVSNLANITVTSACACVSGTCNVGITGTSNYNGAASFSFTVTANGAVSNTSSANFSITAVNDAPTISAIAAQSTNEDTVLAVPFTIGDVDSTLTCSGKVSGTSSDTTILTNANIVITGTYPNCIATLTPGANKNGNLTVTLTVTDGSLTGQSAFALTVVSVDDPPVASNITSATVNEDVASMISLPYTDADGDQATTCSVSNLSNITVSSSCNCSAGVCSVGITGTSNYNGAAGFSFTVTANGVTSNTATANFNIAAVNDAPVMNAISSQSTNEDTALNVSFTISDVDNTLTCAGSVTASSSDTAKVLNSAIAITGTAPNCNAAITPIANANGSVSLTFTVSDGSLTAARTFALTIVPVIDISGSITLSGVADNQYGKTMTFTGITIDEAVSKAEVCISEDSDLNGTISAGEKCNTQTWIDVTTQLNASGSSSTSGWNNYTIKNGVNGASFVTSLVPSCSSNRKYVHHLRLTNSSSNTSEIASSSYTFWSPSCLGATLGIWLDANDTSTMFSNTGCTTPSVSGVASGIACWVDKSNNAYQFNATATAYPTYQASAWSGSRPTVVFSGANDLRKMGINLAPKNVFVALKVISTTQYDGIIGYAGSDYGIRINGSNGWVSDVLNVGGDFIYGGLGAAGSTYVNGSSTTSYTSMSEQILYQNKGAGAVAAWNNVGVGGYFGTLGATTRRMNANVSEIFVCTTDCSSSQTKLEGYMAHKWGMTGNLPANHAYKTTPP